MESIVHRMPGLLKPQYVPRHNVYMEIGVNISICHIPTSTSPDDECGVRQVATTFTREMLRTLARACGGSYNKRQEYISTLLVDAPGYRQRYPRNAKGMTIPHGRLFPEGNIAFTVRGAGARRRTGTSTTSNTGVAPADPAAAQPVTMIKAYNCEMA